jgi:hypothetical protein
MSTLISAQDGWLKEENPDLYHMLKAIDGDAEALAWLENKGPGLNYLTRAITGDRHAAAALKDVDSQELDYLHGAVVNCGQLPWLAERSPELTLLFQAIRGDDAALKRLKRKKASLGKLAALVRELVEKAKPVEPAVTNGQVPLSEGTSADVGLLVAEHHLREHDYPRAIEAFSRAIENSPTADAYEGRARAYRALAQQDEHRARALRDGTP